MNYDYKENPGPCSDCVLMQLVPPERRSEKIPCRHIPFNTSGETLDSLYRCSNQQETEEAVGAWLGSTIQRLEEERAAARQCRPSDGGGTLRGTPLYQKQHPKCFELRGRRMMQEDERDRLEVLIFEEIEETVGTWLRAIIQRLEKEQTAIRRDCDRRPNVDSNAPLPEAPSEVAKPACLPVLDRRRQVLPISGRSGFGKLV